MMRVIKQKIIGRFPKSSLVKASTEMLAQIENTMNELNEEKTRTDASSQQLKQEEESRKDEKKKQ